jgi:hypothetical protein
MLAMTTKSDLRPRNNLTSRGPDPKDGDADLSTPEPERMPLPSGLSALIQAATSQLGQLAEQASDPRHRNGDHQFYSLSSKVDDGAKVDDGESSDRGERLDTPVQTPTMIPEPDPRKQSFPELLMTLAMDPGNVDVITFLPDGKFFVIRAKEFSEEIMIHYFAMTTFEDFLDLSHDWGFSRILQDLDCTGIEVFRHPQFIKGEWEKCGSIKVGTSPTELRVSALPGRARIEYTLSDDSAASASASSSNSKRRLSPSFLDRRASETSVTSQKHRMKDSHDQSPQYSRRRSESKIDSEAGDISNRSDDFRSMALAITTEKLNLKCDSERKGDEEKSTPLIERALESTTHTIVTDAIESLLRDEGHTKETYLKHEKELSRSSLPGIVPLSKQLFSPKDEVTNDENKEAPPEEVTVTAEPESFESLKVKQEKVDDAIPELKSSSFESASPMS